MNGWMNEWMNEWVNEWMNEWMDEWGNEWKSGRAMTAWIVPALPVLDEPMSVIGV